MLQFQRFFGGVLALAILATLVGCGPKMGDCTGKVTLDGEAVIGAEVNFEPIDTSLGTTGTGYTQAPDGAYKIVYPGKDITGVPVGEYKVWIGGGEAGGEEEEGGGTSANVPAKYNQENSKLVATVVGGDNVFDWELTSGE